MEPQYSGYRAHFDRLIEAVLEAADPFRLISAVIQIAPHGLSVRGQQIDWSPPSKLILLAVGKAASPMTLAVNNVLNVVPKQTIVVRPEFDQSPLPEGCMSFQAGHPLPNKESLAAGEAAQTALRDLQAEDLVILLLSGGGSALFELLKKGITYEDLRSVNMDLLRSGAPIEAINIVRKAMSQIKAGGLTNLAAPARVLTLILSDVVGDNLSTIASGPTVFEDMDAESAVDVLKEYRLWDRYPERFQEALRSSRDDVEKGEPAVNILVANNHTIQRAAADSAQDLGFLVNVHDKPLSGDARTAGASFAHQLGKLAEKHPNQNVCLIQGGETTVTVLGDGQGGRNQEFALSAAQVIEHQDRSAILAFATDGIDGPTDAAGAIVDSGSIERANAIDLHPEVHLNENNTYPLLERLGALVRTGPTLTNLNDIALGFTYIHT